jgi:hypothetical protein
VVINFIGLAPNVCLFSRTAAPVPCKFGSDVVFANEEARDKVQNDNNNCMRKYLLIV